MYGEDRLGCPIKGNGECRKKEGGVRKWAADMLGRVRKGIQEWGIFSNGRDIALESRNGEWRGLGWAGWDGSPIMVNGQCWKGMGQCSRNRE